MTKEQLEAENASQREMIAALGSEIDALYALFAAVDDASAAGVDGEYLTGFVRGIDGEQERGNPALLRSYADAIRHHAAVVAAKAEPVAVPA